MKKLLSVVIFLASTQSFARPAAILDPSVSQGFIADIIAKSQKGEVTLKVFSGGEEVQSQEHSIYVLKLVQALECTLEIADTELMELICRDRAGETATIKSTQGGLRIIEGPQTEGPRYGIDALTVSYGSVVTVSTTLPKVDFPPRR